MFPRFDAHRYTGSLNGFGCLVRLLVPPFFDFLKLFGQRIKFVLRKFQIFKPSLVLGLGRGKLVQAVKTIVV